MIIGKRLLSLHGHRETRQVEVRIHAPEPDGTSWICRYEIDWPEGRRDSNGAGFDSIQALHLTLQKIGIELYSSRHHASAQLAWGEPSRGYGFPVPKNARDLLIGEDERFER